MKKKKSHTTAAPFDNNGKDKENKRLAQLLEVRRSLIKHPKSMREISDELGIERSSICWYIGELRKRDEVQIHHKALCKTTGYLVNYYTTDPLIFKYKEDSNE